MPLSAEDTARLQALQSKVLSGNYSLDEVKEGVRIMRADRIAASIAGVKAKGDAAAARAPINPGAILADLKAKAAKLQTGGQG